MPRSPSTFHIQESQTDGIARLSLTGELDIESVSVLEDRLTSLRAARSPVRLDLSKLEFIDSTGLHLLIRTVGDAQMKGWQLQIERDVAPEVMRLFRLVHLDRFVLGPQKATRVSPSGRKRIP